MPRSDMIGEFNSSITRIRPAFQMLFRKNKTGGSWLPEILRLSRENTQFASKLAEDTGRLLPTLLRKRNYSDHILKEHGINEIKLEECFEKSLPPPKRFLQWLIENPSKMSWPKIDSLIHNFQGKTIRPTWRESPKRYYFPGIKRIRRVWRYGFKRKMVGF